MVGYNDIYSTDPNGLSMGMPTVNTQAAVAGAGNSSMAAGGVNVQSGVPTSGPPVPGGAGGVGGAAGGAAKPGFFSQYGPAQFALGAIQTLGSLWNSYQQNKMAKESFKFQKEAYATNLANQEQTYNTELQDRINARYVTEGRADVAGDTAKYVDKNKL